VIQDSTVEQSSVVNEYDETLKNWRDAVPQYRNREAFVPCSGFVKGNIGKRMLGLSNWLI